MEYDFEKFDSRINEIYSWLEGEFLNLQVGKISPSMISNVKVSAYDNVSDLTHLASVNIEDAKTLLITPFDKTIIQEVEKALREQASTFNISVSGNSVRVALPDITNERRVEIERVIKEKQEEGKQSIRAERERVLNDLKANKQNYSEDLLYEIKDNLQKKVDDANSEITSRIKRKIEEIHD